MLGGLGFVLGRESAWKLPLPCGFYWIPFSVFAGGLSCLFIC